MTNTDLLWLDSRVRITLDGKALRELVEKNLNSNGNATIAVKGTVRRISWQSLGAGLYEVFTSVAGEDGGDPLNAIEPEPDWEKVAAAYRGQIEEMNLNRASFLDHLNTYLREEYPHLAPQAEMKGNPKHFLDMLVAILRVRVQRLREQLESEKP